MQQVNLLQDTSKTKNFWIQHPLLRLFFFQFIGVSCLAFFALSTSYTPPVENKHPNPFHQIYVVATLYIIVCFTAPLSGALLNPSVTSMFIRHKKRQSHDMALFFTYFVAQMVGAFVGVALSRGIYDIELAIYAGDIDILAIGKDFIGQLLGTFIFLVFVLKLTNSECTFVYSDSWIHLLIGVLYFIARSMSRHIGALNPAVIIAVESIAIISSQVTSNLNLLAIVVVALGEILGAILAQLFFRRVYLKAVQRTKAKL